MNVPADLNNEILRKDRPQSIWVMADMDNTNKETVSEIKYDEIT